MKKPLWILGIVGATGIYVLVVCLGGAPEARTSDARQSTQQQKPTQQQPGSAAFSPKAVMDSLEHDFGVCDPMERGSHAFIIRNEGNAPLELKEGPTTCKCTLADFPANVPPGETAQVRLSWTARTKYQVFSQEAMVQTNDPEHPRIVFTIKGEVREHLLAEPAEFVFSDLCPGEAQTRSLTLFSQVWDEFEISRIKSSSPSFKWKVKPAPAEALIEVKARSGHTLEVTSPAEQPVGRFQETLTVYVSPKGRPELERSYAILVSGNRVSWLSVVGGGVELGAIPSGQGSKRRLTLLVRDPKQKVKVQRVETNPTFLRAVLTPARTDVAWCHLYHLDLEVPPDAPSCTYLGIDQGELRIVADDSQLPVVKAPVAFAVVAKRAGQ